MSIWDVISGQIPGYDLIASGVNWLKDRDWSSVIQSVGEANAIGQGLMDPPTPSNPDSANNNPAEKNDAQLQADIAIWSSVRDKPFKFNPPLHSRSRPVRVDFGSGWATGGNDKVSVDAAMSDYLADIQVASDTNLTFQSLRLGRIVQSENALGEAATRGDYRWGFRFLYNPPELTTTAQSNMVVRIDPTSEGTLALSGVSNLGPFQSHAFSLLLNRVADLEAAEKLSVGDYAPYVGVSDEDVAGILDRGTMWDLEYLFRTVNGIWNLEETGVTGNMGLLQANPVYLVLGPGINHYGIVTKVGYSHMKFNADLVPTITKVDINFSRSLHITPQQAKEWKTWLGEHGGDPKKGVVGTSGSASPGAAGGSAGGSALLATMQQLGNGKPYVWGATGPNGYDCSGLVWAAMKQLGIYTGPRFTTHTFVSALGSKVTPVSGTDGQVGDVILWASHIGVVDGPGTMYSALSPSNGIRSAPFSWGPKGEGYKFYRLPSGSGTTATPVRPGAGGGGTQGDQGNR